MWDAATGQLLATLRGHPGEVHSTAFSPDGRCLLTRATRDPEVGFPDEAIIKVWDARTYRERLTLPGDTGLECHPAFSPDGGRLLSSVARPGKPSELKVWDVGTGQELLALTPQPANRTQNVAFDSDGRRILALVGGNLKVWDATTGQEVPFGEVPVRGGWLALSPDGRRLATLFRRVVTIWDARAGQEVFTLRGAPLFAKRLSFSSSGTRLATADSAGTTVVIWDGTPREGPLAGGSPREEKTSP